MNMYCPACRRHSRSSSSTCPRCGGALVPGPSASGEKGDRDTADLVPVFSTFEQGQAMLARALLEGEGISYLVQGELYTGSGVYITPVSLLVALERADEARDLLRQNGLEPA